MKTNDLRIAQEWLKHAIRCRDSEEGVRGYIKFMDTLPKEQRERILINPEITKLIDVINREVEGK